MSTHNLYYTIWVSISRGLYDNLTNRVGYNFLRYMCDFELHFYPKKKKILLYVYTRSKFRVLQYKQNNKQY